MKNQFLMYIFYCKHTEIIHSIISTENLFLIIYLINYQFIIYFFLLIARNMYSINYNGNKINN